MRLNIDNLSGSVTFPKDTFVRIEIIDLGNCSVRYDKNVTNIEDTELSYTVNKHHSVLTSPICIWVNNEQVHPGQLKVEMWR